MYYVQNKWIRLSKIQNYTLHTRIIPSGLMVIQCSMESCIYGYLLLESKSLIIYYPLIRSLQHIKCALFSGGAFYLFIKLL